MTLAVQMSILGAVLVVGFVFALVADHFENQRQEPEYAVASVNLGSALEAARAELQVVELQYEALLNAHQALARAEKEREKVLHAHSSK